MAVTLAIHYTKHLQLRSEWDHSKELFRSAWRYSVLYYVSCRNWCLQDYSSVKYNNL